MKYICRIINLPENIKLLAVISIGYLAEEKDRFIYTNVHWRGTDNIYKIIKDRMIKMLAIKAVVKDGVIKDGGQNESNWENTNKVSYLLQYQKVFGSKVDNFDEFLGDK